MNIFKVSVIQLPNLEGNWSTFITGETPQEMNDALSLALIACKAQTGWDEIAVSLTPYREPNDFRRVKDIFREWEESEKNG